jgi:hypothetical protein
MVKFWIVVGLLIPLAAHGQMIDSPSAGSIVAVSNMAPQPQMMATVSVTGEVKIDWKEVERTAALVEPDGAGLREYARLMLAIRDGTWKPLEKTDYGSAKP